MTVARPVEYHKAIGVFQVSECLDIGLDREPKLGIIEYSIYLPHSDSKVL